jgi:hypothetical protein
MATVFSDSQMSSDLGHQTTRADGNGCWTAPDVVEAGVAWLAEYHEAARERQRTARRRREHDKRQRQRAEGGDRG